MSRHRFALSLCLSAQLAAIVSRFGKWLGDSPVVPTWNPDSEFRSLRPGGQ